MKDNLQGMSDDGLAALKKAASKAMLSGDFGQFLTYAETEKVALAVRAEMDRRLEISESEGGKHD